MKKRFFIIALAICSLITACTSSKYNFCQIYETQPVNKNGLKISENGLLTYENDQCKITYNFWSNHGSADFEFHNKTDEIIYLDLTKSFFCRNGMAYNLYRGREWSESSTKSTSYYDSYSYQNSTTSSITAVILGLMTPFYGADAVSASQSASSSKTKSSGESNSYSRSHALTTREQPIIAIPPHKSKYIATYHIKQRRLISCDLQSTPEQSSRATYTLENSPLRFGNYITYTVGADKNIKSVENEFYVSTITNYAEPEIVEFRMRPEPCENLKEEDGYKNRNNYGSVLYDKYTKGGVCVFGSSFYWMYTIESNKRLYKKGKKYLYSTEAGAYVESTRF